jgi:carboxymethylenebutenolidase
MKKLVVVVVGVLALAAALAAQDWAKARLEKSGRHQEWVLVKNGERTVHSFIVYPEVKSKATAVVVIHEIFGLTDWVRGVADQFAEAGYIAIAPDLLSGMGPGGGRTSDIPPDKVREVFAKLPPDQITADLNAVSDYVKKLPAANGKLVVTGFCWGGSQTFRFATNRSDLALALPFYGGGPDKKEDIARINTRVYGFYGGNDARVNATIPTSETLMKEAGKFYEPVIYEGAGHGFMRSGEQPDAQEANKAAREKAWVRVKELLKKIS